jgi:DNA-binding GntR family transcriptional regulator
MSTLGQKQNRGYALDMQDPFHSSPLTLTLPLQIADRIGTGIIEEYFRPGERLKETSLAQSFGVSRATIREALRLLESRGLVTIYSQRGAYVAKLSRKELEDMFEIRAVLLGLASRRVAMAPTPEVKRRLMEGIRALEAARDDGTAYARASAALVVDITRASGNQQLFDSIEAFAQRIGRYARLGLSSAARRQQSLRDWKRLIKAITDGDADAAETLHRELSMKNRDAGLAELDRREREERQPGKPPKADKHPKLETSRR